MVSPRLRARTLILLQEYHRPWSGLHPDWLPDSRVVKAADTRLDFDVRIVSDVLIDADVAVPIAPTERRLQRRIDALQERIEYLEVQSNKVVAILQSHVSTLESHTRTFETHTAWLEYFDLFRKVS